MTEKEIQPIALDGKIIDFKTKEVIEDLDKGINKFKVIETITHDDRRVYELTKNDIGYYNFKDEKLLAHMICNELNGLIEKNNALNKEKQLLKEEKDLLKNKLDRIEDILPHYLSCAEISEFRGKTFEEDLALMKCWNKRYQK